MSCPEDEQLSKSEQPARKALRLHPYYRGKIQVMPKCPIRSLEDFSIWYSPGVAAACRAVIEDPEQVYEYTNRANTIAVISDGSRVLGLGNIGPEAGLPVMEGKALLFKYLGGVDAVPICLDSQDEQELVRTVRLLQPSFGGINLEDIESPKCFRILDELRRQLDIPVWHDDQQGTATVVLAGLLNALEVVGKSLLDIRIAMIGMGAANMANYRLLKAAGVDPGRIIACDSRGILDLQRRDIHEQKAMFAEKRTVCEESNAERRCGGVAEALRGADVCIAFSRPGPDTLKPAWIRRMAADAIVFACANPVPEIWPWEARAAGARIVATGRCDYPNQLNNSLAFPGIFRGVLDVRARTISDGMAIAAARAIAQRARERGLQEEAILSPMDDFEVHPRVAVATAMKAQEEGLAAWHFDQTELRQMAEEKMRSVREAMRVMLREGLIPPPPEDI